MPKFENLPNDSKELTSLSTFNLKLKMWKQMNALTDYSKRKTYVLWLGVFWQSFVTSVQCLLNVIFFEFFFIFCLYVCCYCCWWWCWLWCCFLNNGINQPVIFWQSYVNFLALHKVLLPYSLNFASKRKFPSFPSFWFQYKRQN